MDGARRFPLSRIRFWAPAPASAYQMEMLLPRLERGGGDATTPVVAWRPKQTRQTVQMVSNAECDYSVCECLVFGFEAKPVNPSMPVCCHSDTSVTLSLTMSATSRKQVSRTATQSVPSPVECFSCHKPIRERYLLKALDQFWHEDCLKCSCCDCRLGEVGSTLFTKANLILCKRDYLRY